MFNKCVFKNYDVSGYEEVISYKDASNNLESIIAIHSTKRGSAIGGCRIYPYQSTNSALNDVLRLSRGMTYKTALANINLGGGKAIIISDPNKVTKEAFKSFGEFVDKLNGKYITSIDVGSKLNNLHYIKKGTKHVVGLGHRWGGIGNPGMYTAYGVSVAMKAAVKKLTGSDNLSGISVAIQGIGNVGYHLCQYLIKNNVKLYVADINPNAIRKFLSKCSNSKVTVVDSDEIYDCKVDIFSPCALGAILNDKTIPRLNCAAIVGAANNQLQIEDENAYAIKLRKILYVPDYAANVGGVIGVLPEIYRMDLDCVYQKIEKIYETVHCILKKAEGTNRPPHEIANEMVVSNL